MTSHNYPDSYSLLYLLIHIFIFLSFLVTDSLLRWGWGGRWTEFGTPGRKEWEVEESTGPVSGKQEK